MPGSGPGSRVTGRSRRRSATLLARAHAVHVIVTPAVDVALVVGLFVLAMRRLPRAEWPDVLGVALVSALIWIAQPHAGVTWFHVPSVATYVYGTAIAVWFVAPWRCGWQVPRALWPVLALAGYCVGTSSRAIATATLIGVLLGLRALPRERRVRWMWIALGALVVGVVAGYLRAPAARGRARVPPRPRAEPDRDEGADRGGAGRLVSLIAGADRGSRARSPGDLRRRSRPDARETLRWSIAWFATAIWCLFGPHFYEATLLPATCLLVIATLPYLAGSRRRAPLRFVDHRVRDRGPRRGVARRAHRRTTATAPRPSRARGRSRPAGPASSRSSRRTRRSCRRSGFLARI